MLLQLDLWSSHGQSGIHVTLCRGQAMLPHPNWFEYDFWLFGHKVVSNIDYEFEELADQIELLNRSK